LGVIPCAAEHKIAVVIYSVSSCNKAIHLHRPPDSPIFVLHDFDGEDLQATAEASMCWDGSICINNGANERCNQTKWKIQLISSLSCLLIQDRNKKLTNEIPLLSTDNRNQGTLEQATSV
jgi:hypothetical protein